MKNNNGCSLQKLVNGNWIPVAIRYRQMSVEMRLKLECGLTIESNGETLRYFDYKERQAIACAFNLNTERKE